MAYMNQQKKAIIAEAVKPILKKYGVKGTLSVSNNMSINLNISEGSINFGLDHGSVNTYWIDENYFGDAREFLKECVEALKSAGYYNRSDLMTDYFDVAYHYNINIGRWNKPYKYTGE